MGKFKKEDIKYEMIEFLGSIKENNNSDWSKSVAKIAWNNNPSTIDIRNMKISSLFKNFFKFIIIIPFKLHYYYLLNHKIYNA